MTQIANKDAINNMNDMTDIIDYTQIPYIPLHRYK